MLIACLLAGSLPGQAQDRRSINAPAEPLPQVEIQPLTEDMGLSGNVVVTITQDAGGYMWFGTQSGLNRYDGDEIKQFFHNPEDSTSLSSDWAEVVYVDREGTIWVGAHAPGGLNRYNPATESFTRYLHDPNDPLSLSQDTVTAIVEDLRGNLWIGTHGGLNRLDRETGTFDRYQHDPDDPSTLSNDQVRALYVDRSGTLWVGTGSTTPSETPAGVGGLNRFEPASGTFARYMSDPADPTTLFDNKVRSIYEDSRGDFWVGTLGSVIHKMDRAAGTFERYVYDPDRPDQLQRDTRRSGCDVANVTCGMISFIGEDRTGLLWIGMQAGGVLQFDPVRNRVRMYDASDTSRTAARPSGAAPFSFAQSADGTLWVGTLGSGLNRIVTTRSLFQFFPDTPDDPLGFHGTALNPQGIGTARDGSIWLGSTDQGINRYDPATDTFEHFKHDPDDPRSIPTNDVHAMIETRDGDLWFGTHDGDLFRLDRSTRRTTTYSTGADSQFGDPIILTLRERHDGTIWAGSTNGLLRFDPDRERLTWYRHDPQDPKSLLNDTVTSLFEDSQGAFWVGTSGGLQEVVDGPEGTVSFARRLILRNPLDAITSFYEDADGQLWLGSAFSGLIQFDRAGGPSASYTTANGLSGNQVDAVVADASGSIWVSTSSGPLAFSSRGRLSRFDPETKTAITFGPADRLPTIGFTLQCGTRGADGTLYFCGDGGLMAINPSLQLEVIPPRTILSRLYLFNTLVTPGEDSPLQTALYETEQLELGPRQNDFTISFSGLDFANPEQVRYQYQLVPHDAGWVDAGTQRQARYSSVTPGTYTFKVRAANALGTWNDTPTTLRITLLPPWWRTPWAYALYGLFLVGSVIGVDRLQRRRVVQRERERAQQRELEQARELEKAHTELQATHRHLTTTQAQLIQQEKMASLGQLTAGIAHEIKNPLNFVNNFAEINEELADELLDAVRNGEDLEQIVADLKKNAAVIKQHGTRADDIVQAMMQHASAGTGKRTPTDINQLVSSRVDLAYHGKRARVPELKVEIKQELGTDLEAVAIVPEEIGRVVLNLLGNAFDAVQEQSLRVNGEYEPTVTVSTHKADGQVVIRVQDNGPGIPAEIRGKIFEPFFTTKPTGTGTGLGLSLSYDIVTQGHGGTLTAESEEGQGATFTLMLPVDLSATEDRV